MKSRILELLINTDEYLSGSKIASELNISRAAVWKHIKSLKQEGYDIESVSSKGYKLSNYEKKLNKYELEILLRKLGLDLNVHYLKTVDSTNTYAKRIDDISAIIVAEEQTGGRGRLGRVWSSQRGSGIYFTLMIRPKLHPNIVGMVTQITAVALKRSIGDKAMIKWPNDIFIGDKKLAGVLTELISEINVVERLIVGVGVNISSVKGLSDIATSFSEERLEFHPFEFFESFLKNFFDLLNKFNQTKNLAFIREEVNNNSYFMNRNVNIVGSNKEYVFRGITTSGNAILEGSDGKKEEIFFGELSLKRR